MKGEQQSMRRVQRVHFIGIGGIGMSGIAELLVTQGYQVSGSDLNSTAAIEQLREMGADISLQHRAEAVEGVDAVIVSSAVPQDNPEIERARQLRIPVIPRAEMLATLMRFRQGIAISGTHGKTTTTSMIAAVFAAAGQDPTFVIGGRLLGAGDSARLGSGNYLIAEADESDASFLHLSPTLIVITGIDSDHLEAYQDDLIVLQQAFLEFTQNLPFYGAVILCADDPGAVELIPRLTRPSLTYGLSEGCDYRACDISYRGMQSHFTVIAPELEPFAVTLGIPGEHNVCNALAAIAVALEERLPIAPVCSALEQFIGVQRRFQVMSEHAFGRDVIHIDDYAHHPTELRVTLATARELWPGRRLVVLFQPHRYSRIYRLFNQFVEVLAGVDYLLLLRLYAAGEEPIPGIDSAHLARAIQSSGGTGRVEMSSEAGVRGDLDSILADGDLLLTMGAGSIGRLARELYREGA